MRLWRICGCARLAFGVLIGIVFLASCEEEQPSAPPAPAVVERAPSPWRARGESLTVAVPDEDEDRELAAAIRQARRTAEDARLRWGQAKPEERALWAVKWAARLAAPDAAPSDAPGGVNAPQVEHVWVRPVNWSPFRIEGVLVTEPVAELESGRKAGEIVSFSIEEMTDWVRFASDAPDAAYEGGFTMKVLEQRYGKPHRVRNDQALSDE